MGKQKLHIYFTTDVHGNYYVGDLGVRHKGRGGLPAVFSLVTQTVTRGEDAVLLLDGGDLLQGDLPAFCQNYLTPAAERGRDIARMMDYIGYDAAVVGNHDIEAGTEVVKTFASHCGFPVLAANIVDETTGEPVFEPYAVFHRGGWNVAVVGFCTNAIPLWVPRDRWEGLRFEDMVESAQRWIPYIRETVRPDLLVGVIHSGLEGGLDCYGYRENEVRHVVETVGGMDVVLYGHDHHANLHTLTDPTGAHILCVNPGCSVLGVADVVVSENETEGQPPHIAALVHDTRRLRDQATLDFSIHFKNEFKVLKQRTDTVVGRISADIHIADAFFGPSAYVDFMQQVMLEESGADVAFAAPLYFGGNVPAGDLTLATLAGLYHLDDRLFVLKMTGEEIRRYLERSYAAWIAGMSSPDDPLFLLVKTDEKQNRWFFQNYLFNFDSAAGVRYTVDVTKPEGERVLISSMADGTPFQLDRIYQVCMTGYRASGGGELITKGAGIEKSELDGRIERKLSGYILDALTSYFQSHPVVNPVPQQLWSFVPADWVLPAMERERIRLRIS